jgi:hypothetical protein
VLVWNFGDQPQTATLLFRTARSRNVFDAFEVLVDLPPKLSDDPSMGSNNRARRVDENMYQILKNGQLGPFRLEPASVHALHLRFVQSREHLNPVPFELDLLQKTGDQLIGGQRFVVIPVKEDQLPSMHKQSLAFDGVHWIQQPRS